MRLCSLVVPIWLMLYTFSYAANIAHEEKSFGTTSDGRKVEMFTLKNKQGMSIRLMTRGATLVAVEVPDRNGQSADVVLGFDDLADYESDKNQYFGCTTGRVANRIAKGRFTLDGTVHQLAINNGPNHLHGGGGPLALDKVIWDAKPVNRNGAQAVEFTYQSADGEANYPGNLSLTVTYTLNEDNEIRIDYAVETDQKTPVNLTNHTYFNLSGAGAETVNDHVLTVNADFFTPVDDLLIPTGEITTVDNTPLDFRQPTRIGERLDQLIDTAAKGYDHNFVLAKSSPGELAVAAVLTDPSSGRTLTVSTTEPGVQFYGGNFLDGKPGKQGKSYPLRSACCLETQHFPDSVNHPHFPSTLLEPGQTYRQTCIFAFSVSK